MLKIPTCTGIVLCARFAQRTVLPTSRAFSNKVVTSRIVADIETIQQPLVDFLWINLPKWDDKPFMTCAVSGETLRYGEARSLINNFARYFASTLGLRKGEILAMIGNNSPLYAVTAHAAIEAGLTVSGVSTGLTPGEIVALLQRCKASALIAEPGILSGLDNSVLNEIRVVLPLDSSLRNSAASARSNEANFAPINPDDVAVMPFSSGTTGVPKGVMLTHGNCTTSTVMWTGQSAFSISRPTTANIQDTTFNLLPLSHCFGFNVSLNSSVYKGQHLITIPKFTPQYFVGALRKYRPNGMILVPTVIHMMVNHPAVTADDLSSIDWIITGGASCPPKLMTALQEKAGRRIDVRQGYGLSEAAAVAIFNPRDAPPEKLGSIGLVVPGNRVRVVNTESGHDLGPGEPGEILMKGPLIMRGYFNDDKATSKAIDEQGWFHTGDVGYYDADEYFYIVDRTKDLIKVKGLQVSPTELEKIILEVPEVADVAVVGVPDERSGELPLAFIVGRHGKEIDPKKVISYVNSRVARHKQLAGGVRIISEIPKNPTGKILRRELRKIVISE